MRAVLGDECLLIGWHVFFWKDSAYRTGRYARSAVDALVWMNVKLVVTLVNALDGTDFDAGGIFGSNAGLCDDECHTAHLFQSLNPVRVLGQIWVLPIEQNHLNGEPSGCVEIVRQVGRQVLKNGSGQWSVCAILRLMLKAVLPIHFVMQSAAQPDAVLTNAKLFPEQVGRILLEHVEVYSLERLDLATV